MIYGFEERDRAARELRIPGPSVLAIYDSLRYCGTCPDGPLLLGDGTCPYCKGTNSVKFEDTLPEKKES
mgnify:CR=1 FL=1